MNSRPFGKPPMISSYQISNFRAFSKVEVEDCCRINVVVGDNGSGKTALLEALFLAAGVSPELILRTFDWRGYPRSQLTGNPEQLHEAIWSDLFFRFNLRQGAVISLKGVAEQNRSVTIKVNSPEKMRVIPPDRTRPHDRPRKVPDNTPIEFVWSIQGHGEVVVRPTFEDGNLHFPGAGGYRHVKGSFFAANQPGSAMEVAARFSRLSRQFESEEFVRKFTSLFSKILDLSLELNAGNPMLFAKVKGIPQRIPLTLASGGMSRIAAILLSIAEQANGIVIIDEIENGIYYRRLPETIAAIVAAAQHYNTQLFISTHSQECLEILAPMVQKAPDEFAFVRVVAGEDGSFVRQFAGSQFAQAILDNIEIR